MAGDKVGQEIPDADQATRRYQEVAREWLSKNIDSAINCKLSSVNLCKPDNLPKFQWMVNELEEKKYGIIIPTDANGWVQVKFYPGTEEDGAFPDAGQATQRYQTSVREWLSEMIATAIKCQQSSVRLCKPDDLPKFQWIVNELQERKYKIILPPFRDAWVEVDFSPRIDETATPSEVPTPSE